MISSLTGTDSPLLQFQRMFYSMMIASEDVETQRKGNVLIAYALLQEQKRKGNNGTNALRKMLFMIQSAPLLILSFHCCYDNYAWIPVLSILKFSSHLFMSLRVQAHFGESLKMQLMQLIPTKPDILSCCMYAYLFCCESFRGSSALYVSTFYLWRTC